MVAVQSTMQALGSLAPEFNLPETQHSKNRLVSIDSFVGQPLLVMFICNHCPFVIHIVDQMVALANQAHSQGVAVVAISSNDVQTYPQDGPEAMATFAARYGFEFPYLYDETQAIAKAYSAACTPDFFVFDKEHRLQYRGQMDSSRPGNAKPVSGKDLRAAIAAVLAGENPKEPQTPSVGCNIKWRQGNEPDYF